MGGRRPPRARRSRGLQTPDTGLQTSSRGYTLIEIAAVMAIVLVMMLAGVAAIRSVQKADITTSASMLSASIRYLYDLSVLNNRSYRLVIDLADGAYWAELIDPAGASCGGGLLPSEEERRFGDKDRAAASAGAAEAAEGGGEPVGGGGSNLKDNLLSRKKLPKGLVFPMVMTSHQDEPTEEGRAEIHFFPDGYVERAYIYLRRDETVYTVETIPLKGVGIVHPEELDSRDLLDRS